MEENIKVNYHQLYRTDYGKINALIEEILKLSKINILHILIDEWMEIDKNNTGKLQNYFAQDLKKCFFNNKYVSVKIASIWNRTSLYEQTDMNTSRGLQPGHDIQHSVDLDGSFFRTEEEISNFVKLLLFKRLKRKLPEIEKFEIRDGYVDDEFIREIFDNNTNFRVFVTAGHGIPRDLMRIFEKSFQRIKADFQKYAITYELIFEVTRDIYAEEKRETINPGSATKEMWVRINEYMENTSRRFFFVKPEDQIASSCFRALIDHELLHEVHAPTLPREIRRNFKVYMIDYGTFIDWKSAVSNDVSELLAEGTLPKFEGGEEKRKDDFLVDLITDSSRFANCYSCTKLVERKNPAVIKHGICPICGDDFYDSGP